MEYTDQKLDYNRKRENSLFKCDYPEGAPATHRPVDWSERRSAVRNMRSSPKEIMTHQKCYKHWEKGTDSALIV